MRFVCWLQRACDLVVRQSVLLTTRIEAGANLDLKEEEHIFSQESMDLDQKRQRRASSGSGPALMSTSMVGVS
jgi:hypothetical protein